MKKFSKTYQDIITVENLLLAWQEFLRGKAKRKDVAFFQRNLMDNILALRKELLNRTYCHGVYQAFNISDPKPRNIHKASVRDRLLHHLLYRETYQYFDARFIDDSYSCRLDKGTHRAIYRFNYMARKASNNGHRTVWVLKCDIRKFFASIDHEILTGLLLKYIEDQNLLWLFSQVIKSFEILGRPGRGLPLGNLTSQLLVNVYMNEFDRFLKQNLRVKYYLRYADDFLFLSLNKVNLLRLQLSWEEFLNKELKLSLHSQKVFLKTLASGVDFLGWIEFGDHRILRPVSRKRMMKKIAFSKKSATLVSYQGMLKHGNSYKLTRKLILFNQST